MSDQPIQPISLTPAQQSRLRMAQLNLAIVTLPEFHHRTLAEQRYVLSELLRDLLRAGLKRGKR